MTVDDFKNLLQQYGIWSREEAELMSDMAAFNKISEALQRLYSLERQLEKILNTTITH
jgi:CO dehydrogenase/acetyl-CoA synthase beta subunit